jgi:Flp pilus assembly protein TadG
MIESVRDKVDPVREPSPPRPESPMPRRRVRSRRRGAAAVEFAVVAPVFLLLVFGIVEFGRMLMVHQVLTNAAREGARRAVLRGTTSADVVNTVRNYLAGTSINAQAATVALSPESPSSSSAGDPMTVAVSIPFAEVSWLPTPAFLGDKKLSASSTMRRE